MTPYQENTHYRNPEYVRAPINVGFIGWLLLLGVPALMLFLIYEKEQSQLLETPSSVAVEQQYHH